jgi:hypothetical protein
MGMTLVFQLYGAHSCVADYSAVDRPRLLLFVRLAQPTRIPAITAERIAVPCAHIWH